MTTDTWELIKKWAAENNHDPELFERVLIAVCDEEHVAMKIVDGDRVTSSETIRTILAIESIAFENVKGTVKRVIPIGKGVTLLAGGNDSGKTAAQLAARWLIGGSKGVGVGTDERMIRAGQEEMAGKLILEGDNRYIARSITRRVVKKGKDAGQTKVDRSILVKLNGHEEDKPSKAQLEIDSWLGTDIAFVLSLAFIEQGTITALIDADPAERKEAVFKLLGLKGAEETAKKLRAIMKKWKDERDADLANRASYEATIAQLTQRFSQFPMEELIRERQLLEPVAAAADATVAEQRGTIQKRVSEIDAEAVMKLEIPIEPIDVQTVKLEAARLGTEAGTAHTRAELLRAKYKEIYALPDTCPVCATTGKTCEISPDWKRAQLFAIRDEGGKLAALAEQKKEARDHAQNAADQAEKAEQLRRFRLEQQTMLAAERARLVDQLAQLPQGATPDASAVERFTWVCDKIREAQVLREKIGEAQFKIDLIDTYASKLVDGMSGLDEMHYLEIAVQAFSKDGVPLWLARGHINAVNQLAREMGAGDRYIFSFGGDLEVQVFDTKQDLAQVSPQLASGSSRERGALILAAAMSRYQQHVARIHCPLLWVDEMPFQDPVNAQVVIETVKRLTKWFDRVVFASSDFEPYLGRFDHEVMLPSPDVSVALDEKRERAKALASEGQAQLPPGPAPEVRRYQAPKAEAPPLSKIADPAKDRVDAMLAANVARTHSDPEVRADSARVVDEWKEKADEIVARLTREAAEKGDDEKPAGEIPEEPGF